MILIIDNYDSFVYNIYQLVVSQGVPCQVVRNDAMALPDLKKLTPSALIISPGPGRPEDAGICLEAIRYFMGKIPILGVCLGHQAIAQVLGSQVVLAPVVMHGKVSQITHQSRGVFKNLPSPIAVARYHSLCVDRVPKGCEALAYSSEGCLMAFHNPSLRMTGLQFHPESIATEGGVEMIQQFLQTQEQLCA